MKKADSESKYILQDSINPLTDVSTIQVSADEESHKGASQHNDIIAKESGESLQRSPDSKLL
ncbi:MAG TPA: hypothetical protein VK589_09895, partial [Chryseolinea sp.]|nr:hypothetical protein [Chryseolinea sp.]